MFKLITQIRITIGVSIIIGANFIVGHIISAVLDENQFQFDNYMFDNSSIFTYNKSLLILSAIQPYIQRKSKTDILLNDDTIDGCSLIWENKVYTFGGVTNPKRALRLESCQFKQYRVMTFDFVSTSCLSHNLIYLCFANETNEYRTCRYSKSPWDSFGEYPDVIVDSFFDHSDVIIAATDTHLIAIGGSTPPSANVELYDFEEQSWIIADSYPYSNVIHTAPVVAYKLQFYVFGGYPTQDLVARFDTVKWSIVGRLTAPRASFSFVLQSQFIFIFGGSSIMQNGTIEWPTEKCLLTLSEDIQCSAQMPVTSATKIITVDDTVCV